MKGKEVWERELQNAFSALGVAGNSVAIELAADCKFSMAARAVLIRLLHPHKAALCAAHRMGGDNAVSKLATQLLEAENERLCCDKNEPAHPNIPVWIVPPVAIGIAHVDDVMGWDKPTWDKEAGIVPLLFGRARIFVGPVGRRFIDEWWEYASPIEALVAFAMWQEDGFDGEPGGNVVRHSTRKQRKEQREKERKESA